MSRPLKHADVEHQVETRCPAGHPQVLRCYPLRTGGDRFEPFPTLFWLVCPAMVAAISRLEHDGWIPRLTKRLEEDDDFGQAVARDHRAYATERWTLLRPADQAEIERRGLGPEFRERGIGGIRNQQAVKCLHLHYAHHLARSSAIGRAIDDVLALSPCPAPAR